MLYSPPRMPVAKKISGFTLLELIIVIIILGVMSVGISGFITLSTQTYLNVTERDELLSSARFAVERLNRELRNAVPNSIRTIVDNNTSPTKQCIEFIPIKASTVYTDIPVKPDPESNQVSVVSFNISQSTFYSCPIAPASNCNDYIVVYPLEESDVYNFDVGLGEGKVSQFKAFPVALDLTDDIWTVPVEPDGGMVFDEHSPTERLYIFDSTVSYCISGIDFELTRHQGNSFNNNQLIPASDDSVLMAENLIFDKDELPFTYAEASLQRNAVVQVKLTFDRDGEVISFDNDVHIENVP